MFWLISVLEKLLTPKLAIAGVAPTVASRAQPSRSPSSPLRARDRPRCRGLMDASGRTEVSLSIWFIAATYAFAVGLTLTVEALPADGRYCTRIDSLSLRLCLSLFLALRVRCTVSV